MSSLMLSVVNEASLYVAILLFLLLKPYEKLKQTLLPHSYKPCGEFSSSGLFEGARFVMIRPEFAARIQFDAFIQVFLHGRIAVNCVHILF